MHSFGREWDAMKLSADQYGTPTGADGIAAALITNLRLDTASLVSDFGAVPRLWYEIVTKIADELLTIDAIAAAH